MSRTYQLTHLFNPPSPKYGLYEKPLSQCSRCAPSSGPHHHPTPTTVLEANGLTHIVLRACCSNFRNLDASDVNVVKSRGPLVRGGEEGYRLSMSLLMLCVGTLSYGISHLFPFLTQRVVFDVTDKEPFQNIFQKLQQSTTAIDQYMLRREKRSKMSWSSPRNAEYGGSPRLGTSSASASCVLVVQV